MGYDDKNDQIELQLLQTKIQADFYQVDLALFDRGQKLSAELLRLSLGGIAVVGFFITKILTNTFAHSASCTMKLCLSCAVLAFVLSSLFSLLQMYFASGSMFHHIKFFKLKQPEDQSLREAKLNIAHRFLMASAIFLVIAAGFLGTAFIVWMHY